MVRSKNKEAGNTVSQRLGCGGWATDPRKGSARAGLTNSTCSQERLQ